MYQNVKVSSLRLLITFTIMLLGAATTFMVMVYGWSENFLFLFASFMADAKQYVDGRFVFVGTSFFFVYSLATFFCLPILLILSISAGYFFGTFGLLLASFGCATGSVLFVSFSGGGVREIALKAGIVSKIELVEKAFQKSPLIGVFLIRLLPIVPFPAGTFAMTILPTTKRSVFFGTLFGVMPGTTLYVFLGDALSSVDFFLIFSSPHMFITIDIVAPVLAILCMSLVFAALARRL